MHVATNETEHSALALLNQEVFQSHAFLVGCHLTLQLADIDAGNGVLSRTLAQPAVHRTVLYAVDGKFQVGPNVEVSHIEEATLGFVGILARTMVVGLVVDTIHIQQPFAVFFVVFHLGNQQFMGNQLSFLVLAFPASAQSFDLTLVMSIASLNKFQLAE